MSVDGGYSAQRMLTASQRAVAALSELAKATKELHTAFDNCWPGVRTSVTSGHTLYRRVIAPEGDVYTLTVAPSGVAVTVESPRETLYVPPLETDAAWGSGGTVNAHHGIVSSGLDVDRDEGSV